MVMHIASIYKMMRRWVTNVRLNIQCVNSAHHFENVNSGVAGLVFSRDRPMQLEALIDSYFECASDAARLCILYKTSSSLYDSAYKFVMKRHASRPISWIAEMCFCDDLMQLLASLNNGRVFFLVDDVMFVRGFNLLDFVRLSHSGTVPSMRLGVNINWSYTDNKYIGSPALRRIGTTSFFRWNQWCGRGEWAYPFSVDGNIYSAREILELASRLHFNSPNSFEAQMNRYRWALRARHGVCAEYPVLINIPANRVQDEIHNRSGSASVAEMARALLDGYLIDWRAYLGTRVSATHCELMLRYRRVM